MERGTCGLKLRKREGGEKVREVNEKGCEAIEARKGKPSKKSGRTLRKRGPARLCRLEGDLGPHEDLIGARRAEGPKMCGKSLAERVLKGKGGAHLEKWERERPALKKGRKALERLSREGVHKPV